MKMSTPLLSVCIPTYKNSKVLSRNVAKLEADLRASDAEAEIVITENYSGECESEAVRKLQSRFVRVFNSCQNLGFSKNLLLSMCLARGRYLMLLGDDDFVEGTLIHDVVQYLRRTESKELTILPLSSDDNKGGSANASPEYVFMRSGSMMGLIFNRDVVRLSQVATDGAIYPQVELAMCNYFEYGARIMESNGRVKVGVGVELEERFNDKMARPLDYGVAERISILSRLKKRYSLNRLIYLRCYLWLISWSNSIYVELITKRPLLASRYAWEVFLKSPDKISYIGVQTYFMIMMILRRLRR